MRLALGKPLASFEYCSFDNKTLCQIFPNLACYLRVGTLTILFVSELWLVMKKRLSESSTIRKWWGSTDYQ